MNRNEWKFEYQCSIVGEAARRKEDFHRERQNVWAKRYEEAMEKAKASATIREVPVGISNTYRAKAPGAMAVAATLESYVPENIDTDVEYVMDYNLKQDAEAARNRFNTHRQIADTFQAFRIALEANPDKTVVLDVEDINYFGLGGWNPEDEKSKDL